MIAIRKPIFANIKKRVALFTHQYYVSSRFFFRAAQKKNIPMRQWRKKSPSVPSWGSGEINDNHATFLAGKRAGIKRKNFNPKSL